MRPTSPTSRLLLTPLAWVWASPATVLGLTVGLTGLLSGGRARCVGRTLEFHGGFVRWFLLRLARRASAMTLGHVILGQTLDDLTRTRRHELVHVAQYERWGPLFLPAYILCAAWLYVRGRDGYWENPFERQAYDTCAAGMPSDGGMSESPSGVDPEVGRQPPIAADRPRDDAESPPELPTLPS